MTVFYYFLCYNAKDAQTLLRKIFAFDFNLFDKNIGLLLKHLKPLNIYRKLSVSFFK